MTQTAFHNTVWTDASAAKREHTFLQYTLKAQWSPSGQKDPKRPAHKGIQMILEERGL